MPRYVDPEHARQVFLAHGLTPLQPFTRSNDPWRSRCQACKTEVAPTYNDVNRERSRGNCQCRATRISAQLRMPDDEAVAIMRFWRWEPLAPYPGAGAAWNCRCLDCGTEYPKRLSHVQDGLGGCRACAGRDYTDDQARRIMQDAGLQPRQELCYPGGNLPWPSTCKTCGGDVTAVTLSRVKQRSSYCPICWEVRRGDALKLTAAEAHDRMAAALWRPLESCPGVDKPWRSECLVCGTVGKPRLHNIRGTHRSCDTCAERGIDLQKPGYLYLVVHDQHQAGKLGIATDASRVKQHEARGWATYRSWPVQVTEIAWAAEQEVLAWIRRSGRAPTVPASLMRHGGWTETFGLSGSDGLRVSRVSRAISDVLAGRKPVDLNVVAPPRPLHPRVRRTR